MFDDLSQLFLENQILKYVGYGISDLVALSLMSYEYAGDCSHIDIFR